MTEQDILDTCKPGYKFRAAISGYDDIEGKIQFGICDGKTRVFLCHDNKHSDSHGNNVEDKLGYKWSWMFDSDVADFTILSSDPIIINNYPIF